MMPLLQAQDHDSAFRDAVGDNQDPGQAAQVQVRKGGVRAGGTGPGEGGGGGVQTGKGGGDSFRCTVTHFAVLYCAYCVICAVLWAMWPASRADCGVVCRAVLWAKFPCGHVCHVCRVRCTLCRWFPAPLTSCRPAR